jgi:hypothetical protein
MLLWSGGKFYFQSNFIGIGETDYVERWLKKSKEFEAVNWPEIVKYYNYGMGRFDLLDQLISFNRIFYKSKKLTLRVFMHLSTWS